MALIYRYHIKIFRNYRMKPYSNIQGVPLIKRKYIARFRPSFKLDLKIISQPLFSVCIYKAVSAGKVLAHPKKDSLGNKVVLALPYTNTPVALLQYSNTLTLQ